jgi:lipopolysaccharide transport system permease protein
MLKSMNNSSPAARTVEIPSGAHIRIQPTRGWVALDLKEIWRYRELLFFLTWRDIKVRYKQTALGAAWAILQPLLTMVIFSVIFGQLAKLPSDGVPYPIFTYTALLPWQLFAFALGNSSNSLVLNQNLVSKVYFPRLVIPISALLPGLLDFGISFVVLICLMAYYHIPLSIRMLTLPLFLMLALATATGIGLWLSALNVQYRDVRYAVPFLTTFWQYATPIAYSTTLIPEKWRLLYGLNPMTGVVEGFRWALLGKGDVGPLIWISVIIDLLMLFGGLFYFRRMEDGFADVI